MVTHVFRTSRTRDPAGPDRPRRPRLRPAVDDEHRGRRIRAAGVAAARHALCTCGSGARITAMRPASQARARWRSSIRGGTGKTTTSVAASRPGSRSMATKVLLVDTDSQGNVGVSLGVKTEKDALPHARHGPPRAGGEGPRELRRPALRNETLAAAELYLAGRQNRDRILKDRLAAVMNRYDVVLLDCSPSSRSPTRTRSSSRTASSSRWRVTSLSLVGVRQVIKTVNVNSLLHHPVQIHGVNPSRPSTTRARAHLPRRVGHHEGALRRSLLPSRSAPPPASRKRPRRRVRPSTSTREVRTPRSIPARRRAPHHRAMSPRGGRRDAGGRASTPTGGDDGLAEVPGRASAPKTFTKENDDDDAQRRNGLERHACSMGTRWRACSRARSTTRRPRLRLGEQSSRPRSRRTTRDLHLDVHEDLERLDEVVRAAQGSRHHESEPQRTHPRHPRAARSRQGPARNVSGKGGPRASRATSARAEARSGGVRTRLTSLSIHDQTESI